MKKMKIKDFPIKTSIVTIIFTILFLLSMIFHFVLSKFENINEVVINTSMRISIVLLLATIASVILIVLSVIAEEGMKTDLYN